MQDVNDRGNGDREDERLYGNSVLPIQFFCKPKTAPKNVY